MDINITTPLAPHSAASVIQTSPTRVLLSKKQLLANRVSESFASQVKWKSLIPEAHAVWGKIAVEQLAAVGGQFPQACRPDPTVLSTDA